MAYIRPRGTGRRTRTGLITLSLNTLSEVTDPLVSDDCVGYFGTECRTLSAKMAGLH